MLDEQARGCLPAQARGIARRTGRSEGRGNVERAEQAEQEIDVLTSELSRAVGLGGRDRRAASASERARQSIAKTIKSQSKGSRRAARGCRSSSHDALEPATSVPASLTPIIRLHGSLLRPRSTQTPGQLQGSDTKARDQEALFVRSLFTTYEVEDGGGWD